MLESVYSLISTSGEYTMSLLHKYFGFPCMRTCRNIRDRIKAKYRIDENILNGSFESFQKLIKLFWKSTDQRCVVAVDAAAINSKITIHKDGKIEALLHDISIDTDLIDLITSNSDAFYAFTSYIKMRLSNITLSFMFAHLVKKTNLFLFLENGQLVDLRMMK